MKKYAYIYTFLVAILLFTGCSNEDNDQNPELDSDYYFRFKENSTLVDYPYSQYSQQATYIYKEGYGHELIVVSRKQSNSTSINSWSLAMGTWDECQTQYDYTESTPVSILGALILQYWDENGTWYYSSRNYGKATIRIQEITESYISGSFSGTLLDIDVSGAIPIVRDSVLISDGEFKVPTP
ncbi:hypothetical protein [Algoriphagus sp. Y33]|uniref:hypothetical protein n=1 Tax=Algoriphagus sp. Y33 TaxID=2772483 RepID=UPI00177AF430|nr:hypothetical protein [Algoriphagus sp. Y33]